MKNRFFTNFPHVARAEGRDPEAGGSPSALPADAGSVGHGTLYAILVAGWLLLTVSGFGYLLKDSHTRVAAEFATQAEAEATDIKAQLRGCEAVIGGFAGFLAAVPDPTHKQAADYARNVLGGFPYIYMLEAVEAVPRRQRESYRSSLSAGREPLTIRSFSYDTTREFQTPTEAAVYYPVTFMWPELPAASGVLGLDLVTVPHLREALLAAFNSRHAVATRPFTLVEGDLAYVMMQRVDASDTAGFRNTVQAPERLVLQVIRARDLSPTRSVRPLSRTVWVLRDGAPVEPALVATPDAPAGALETRLLPRFERDIDDVDTAQPIRLRVGRQMRFADFDAAAWRSVTIVSVLSLTLILLYVRQHHQTMLRREADYQQARWGALHDPLTGLPNRQLLVDRLHRSLAYWRRSNVGFALIFIDLDHFKSVNDTYGHDAGDALLNATATRLESVTRETDTISRYAGDEFVVLAAQLTDREAIGTIADKIRFVLSQALDFDGQLIPMTASLGIAICPDDGHDPDTLLRAADQSMYAAKRAGRNGVAFSSGEFPRPRGLRPAKAQDPTPIRLVR